MHGNSRSNCATNGVGLGLPVLGGLAATLSLWVITPVGWWNSSVTVLEQFQRAPRLASSFACLSGPLVLVLAVWLPLRRWMGAGDARMRTIQRCIHAVTLCVAAGWCLFLGGMLLFGWSAMGSSERGLCTVGLGSSLTAILILVPRSASRTASIFLAAGLCNLAALLLWHHALAYWTSSISLFHAHFLLSALLIVIAGMRMAWPGTRELAPVRARSSAPVV